MSRTWSQRSGAVMPVRTDEQVRREAFLGYGCPAEEVDDLIERGVRTLVSESYLFRERMSDLRHVLVAPMERLLSRWTR